MSTKRAVRPAQLAEKTILGFIAGAAVAIGVVEAVLLTMRVGSLASDASTTVTGLPLADVAADEFTGASGLVSAAQFESLSLTIESLPSTARGYLIAATVVTSLLAIGICAVVAWLCVRVFVGRPFVRSATWGIGAVAILVIFAALAGPTLTGVAHAEIVEHLGLDGTGLPAFGVAIDFAPIGWGLALAVVAGAFELGQRMQRDTEGLV